MAATATKSKPAKAPAKNKDQSDKGKAPEAEEKKEPTREELIKDALSRAGISTDLSGYEKDQLDRAASVSPQRRGRALREFIMTGPKSAAPPRDVRQINWNTPFKHDENGQAVASPGYLIMLKKPGAKNFELVGTHQGTGVEGEKAAAELLGVSYPEGLRELVEKGQVLSMNARYVNLSDGATQPQATADKDEEATADKS